MGGAEPKCSLAAVRGCDVAAGGRFEHEGVVPPSMGNARPSMARQFLAMVLAAAGLPSSGLLALACMKSVPCVPKRWGVEGPLGGLPVSKPGVCCDTGLLACVMGYPAAFAGTWCVERERGKASMYAGCDGCSASSAITRRVWSCGQLKWLGAALCLCKRARLECVCVCGLQLRVSTLCHRRLQVGAGAPPSAVVTPPASSGSSAKAPAMRRLGAR